MGSVRPGSGTTFVAMAEGVTVDAAGALAAIKLSSVTDRFGLVRLESALGRSERDRESYAPE